MPEPLLTTQEVAQMAGVKSVSTVSGWVRAGRLKRAEGGGADRAKALFRQSDVEAFLAESNIRTNGNSSSNGKKPTNGKKQTTPEETIRQALRDLDDAHFKAFQVIDRALSRVELDVRQRIAQDVLGKSRKGGRK